MKWDVRGAWKADGRPGQLVVEAANQHAGELIAADRGMLVESCWPLAGGGRRRGGFARKAGIFLAVVGATVAVVGLAMQTALGEMLFLGGAGAAGLGVLMLVLGILLGLFGKRGA